MFLPVTEPQRLFGKIAAPKVAATPPPAPSRPRPPACSDAKILRSYLDVVMQGYFQQFGQSGLERFMETTLNFDCPILEDRAAPRYPRATQLSDEEIELFARFR